MDNNESNAGGGITFLALLTIMFIGLKLAGIIDWAWAWVLAPLWAPVAVAIIVVTVSFIINSVAKRIR